MSAESMTVTDDRPAGEPGTEEPRHPGEGTAAGRDEADYTEGVGPEVSDVPLVDAGEISDALTALGSTTHGLFGHPDVESHWNFTPAEVAALAPPLASIINRHARLRAIAQRSPELAVGMALGRWGIRNARLSAAIKQAEAELADREADVDAETPEVPETPEV